MINIAREYKRGFLGVGGGRGRRETLNEYLGISICAKKIQFNLKLVTALLRALTAANRSCPSLLTSVYQF
jgi:hypothetical protein